MEYKIKFNINGDVYYVEYNHHHFETLKMIGFNKADYIKYLFSIAKEQYNYDRSKRKSESKRKTRI